MSPTHSDRDVAIVSYARYADAQADDRNEVEMLMPVLAEALGAVGLQAQDAGFVCSGSSDYLAGQPFAFVNALNAVGPWPPLAESHVEMDAAFALFEAWLRLQHGDIDTALVYGFGFSSPGDLARVLALQTDPYHVAPMFPDAVSLAGLQARQLLDTGAVTEERAAEIVAAAMAAAVGDAYAQRSGELTVDDVLASERWADPLRKLDCPPISDGCSVVVLAAGDRARELTDTPVWIRGMDHRIEPAALGVRDLTDSPSTRAAAAGAGADGHVDLAELHAPFSYQQALLEDVLGLRGNGTVVNPSGGALASNPVMAAGLDRIGQAATRLQRGEGHRALAHATSGPCLQQNLVAVLEVSA
jgi:acetyl-CoA acetyltransferase